MTIRNVRSWRFVAVHAAAVASERHAAPGQCARKTALTIDGAILDVNLGGEKVFPAADLLTERGIPFVFTTGYDASAIPVKYAEITLCEKPVRLAEVCSAIGR